MTLGKVHGSKILIYCAQNGEIFSNPYLKKYTFSLIRDTVTEKIYCFVSLKPNIIHINNDYFRMRMKCLINFILLCVICLSKLLGCEILFFAIIKIPTPYDLQL